MKSLRIPALLTAVLAALTLSPAARAADWYVSTNGVDTAAGTSWATAFLSISNGVAHASGVDTVYVSNGVYNVSTQIVIAAGITVQSFPLDSGATIIDAGSVNGRRCVYMNHAGATLNGFTLRNGRGTDQGGAVFINSGMLRNCIVRDSQTYYVNTVEDGGGGICMVVGLVTNCVVRDNTSVSAHRAWGGGISMYAGLVIDCVISNNSINSGNRENGGGIRIGGGTVDCCRIVYNRNLSTTAQYENDGGGGVYLASASSVLRNSTVMGNQIAGGVSYGGGVRMQGGAIQNCSITRNYSATSSGGVYLPGGTIVNSIVYFNNALSAPYNLATGSSATFSCAPELTSGSGNITIDPGLRNAGSGSGYTAAIGDFHLLPTSSCIDTGTTVAAITRDLDGERRPVDGNGSGTSEYDLGADEDDPTNGPLRCWFVASTNFGFGTVTAGFTTYVEGADTNGLVYYWDFDNNGIIDTNGSDLAVVTNTYAAGGLYSVALTISNAASAGFTLVRPSLIAVLVDADAYVSPAGSHTTPFDTWDKAATNIQAAVDVIQALVAGGGTHRTVWITNATFVVNAAVSITGNITVRGTNGSAGVIVNGNAATRCFEVNSAGAILDSVTVSNGQWTSDGSGIWLNNGTVTNCVITACRNFRAVNQLGGTLTDARIINNTSGNGGGLILYGGTAVGCTITNNYSGSGGGVYLSGGTLANSTIAANQNPVNGAYGHGVYMTGGTVTNCLIRNNGVPAGLSDTYAGGVYMTGGRLVGCTVVSNLVWGSNRNTGGGVWMNGAGATVDACRVMCNEARGTGGNYIDYNGGGGVTMHAGLLRNCLIAGNLANGNFNVHFGGGVRMKGGRMENCTLVRNCATNQSDAGGVYREGGTITNCIVYFNTTRGGGTIANIAAGNAFYSCAPELTTGSGNIPDDPLFLSAGSGSGLTATNGNYHLSLASPCVDAGAAASALNDLDGTARPLDGDGSGTAQYDIGAYELDPAAGALQCTFRGTPTAGLAPLTVVFTALTAGTNTSIATYVWDFDNNGTPDASGADKRVVTNEYATEGSKSIALTVTNTASETASALRTNYVVVAPITRVSPYGSQTPPYTTWDTAATNIQVAIDYASAGSLVVVTDGTYRVTAPVTISKALNLQSVNGPFATIVDAGGQRRCFSLANSGAIMDGFTARGGYATNGAGVLMSDGTIRNCIIRNNNDLDGTGGGVNMQAGTLQNSLIVGNRSGYPTHAVGRGGGVAMSGGTMLNCTVSRNTAGQSEGGVYNVGGAILNSILADNLAPTATNINAVAGVTNSCAPELASGPGNITAAPRLTDVGTGHGLSLVGGAFRLGISSPCIDAGTNLASITSDMTGLSRPRDGNADGVAITDMGAYEVADPATGGVFRCDFYCPNPGGYAPLTAVLTANVAGPNTNITAYVWDFTYDGLPDASGIDNRVVTNSYTDNTQWYSVALTCTNSTGGVATYVATNVIQMPVDVAYVALSGSNTPPYRTLASAATNIGVAIDEVRGTNNPTVIVSNGTYRLASYLGLLKPIAVRSTGGATATVISAPGAQDVRVLTLAATGALLDGFTVSNGIFNGQGGGIWMSNGRVQNCVVAQNNCSGPNSVDTGGGGIYMSAGIVSNCLIRNNYVQLAHMSYGGGVLIDGGTLQNSLIVSNWVDSAARQKGGGVCVRGGLVKDCVVTLNEERNVSYDWGEGPGGGGVWVEGGNVRDCLITGNRSHAMPANLTDSGGGGVYVRGLGIVENCTIARNQADKTGGGVFRLAGVITNSIAYFNTAPAGTNVNSAVGFAYSCAPELTSGTGNITADPQFWNSGSGFGLGFTNGDFHVKSSSPCIDTGTTLGWMTGALDLAGSPRLYRTADMGAYEAPPPSGTVFFVR